MAENYPYVSIHYFSKNFFPQELIIEEKHLVKATTLGFYNESQFIIVLKGKGFLEVNQLKIPLKEKDILQLSSYHAFRFLPDESEGLHIYQISFSLGLLLLTSTNEESYLKIMKKLEYSFSVYHLLSKKFSHLISLCEDLLEEQNYQRTNENLNIALTSYLVYLIQTQGYTIYQYNQQSLALQALQYLQFRHQDQLTKKQVATHFQTTETDLEKALLTLTNLSFSALLSQVRIRNATALMTFPELTITAISEICGFQTVSHFYKEFKKVHQCTPENFRQELKERNQRVTYDDAWDILNYLMNHRCENLTLSSLSDNLHLDSFAINQLLKEKFQMTFKSLFYLLKVQVVHALLITTDLSLDEIQERTGFKDRTSFFRNYKYYYHQTPSQTRKKQ